MSRFRMIPLVGFAFAFCAAPVVAQPLGTFRWQLQPYCHVLTLTVVQVGINYTLSGTDDRCGMSRQASAAGIAYLNPTGSVSLGITEVMPGSLPIHIDATIDLASLSGTWRDSGGSTGSFVFTPGPGTGGPMRTVPSAGIAPATITTVQLAPSAVGQAQIAPNAVTGEKVLDGSLTHAEISDWPTIFVANPPSMVGLDPYGGITVVGALTVLAPTAGHALVNVSGNFTFPSTTTNDLAFCNITSGPITDLHVFDGPIAHEFSPGAMEVVPFAGTRVLDVGAGATTIRLLCAGSAQIGSFVIDVAGLRMNALFIAGS